MSWLELLFWICTFLVLYTYIFYPLVIGALARLRRGNRNNLSAFDGSVSIVMAVHNEASRIEHRISELIQLLDQSHREGEIIVVSDGSTDATVFNAQQIIDPRVRIIELPQNCGKAYAISHGCTAAANDILVLTDVRQKWSENAIDALLSRFADPSVGAVSGELMVESTPGVMSGVGLYWRYEKWIRQQESRVHSTVGVTGAICAVRRDLFRPIPPGIILDDVYWPMCVVMQGYRVVHVKEAEAYDQFPERPKDEFKRKVRTLSGNFQLIARLPQVLLPGYNPVWFQFLSHKVLRLLMPWALLVMLVSNAFLRIPLYRGLLAIQIIGYLLGFIGLCSPVVKRERLLAAASSFLVLNAAAWFAFWVWISGRAERSWQKVDYNVLAPSSLESVSNHSS